MIEIDIPGFKLLKLSTIVLDFNGTLAVDGHLAPGAAGRLTRLARDLEIHVITADTFGRVKQEMAEIPCQVAILPKENQAGGKADYVARLGADRCACVGNGRNDRLMLKDAALGIAVMLAEGCSTEALQAADVLAPSIADGLDLLLNPLRLVATLRS